MRVLIQRTKHASVTIEGRCKSAIKQGLLVLVGIEDSDGKEDIEWLCKKIVNLRIFDDENGVMNRSVLDIEGEILVVSQFTLHASTKKGNRPSYINALGGDDAIKLYELFNKKLNEVIETKSGIFGADMEITLTNDGPVTIILESK